MWTSTCYIGPRKNSILGKYNYAVNKCHIYDNTCYMWSITLHQLRPLSLDSLIQVSEFDLLDALRDHRGPLRQLEAVLECPRESICRRCDGVRPLLLSHLLRYMYSHLPLCATVAALILFRHTTASSFDSCRYHFNHSNWCTCCCQIK